MLIIGHSDDDVIYQNPSRFALCIFVTGLCYLNVARIARFKYERKSEIDSGSTSETTPSFNYRVYIFYLHVAMFLPMT